MFVNWLRQQLFSDSVYLQTGEGLQELNLGEVGRLWIVARSECVFRTLDVAAVPVSRRTQAVAAQIPLLSPFPNPGYWCNVQEGEAKIWIWDGARQNELAAESGVEVTGYEVVPEACFAQSCPEGACFYQSNVGYFAHVWRDGVLVADSWWRDDPGEIEWSSFLRGLGVFAQQKPELRSIDFQEKNTWVDISGHAGVTQSVEPVVIKLTIAVFLFLLGFQSTGSLRLVYESYQLRDEVASISETHRETVVLRERALSARAKGQQLADLETISQIDLMTRVSESLPPSSGKLIKWRYHQGELEVIVADPEPDLESYVRSIESISFLERVSVEPVPRAGQLKFSAEVEQ